MITHINCKQRLIRPCIVGIVLQRCWHRYSSTIMSEQPEQPEPKRRRRSGWDVQTAPTAASEQVNEELLKQQAQQALMAQQIALQKAQQVIAQQALQKTLSGINIHIPKPGSRIYVGSIHYDLREPDIVALFSTFGTIVKSEMSMDPQTGRSKGFCFLEFADPACAEAAMAMDGFELAGRKIKVGKPLHGQSAAGAGMPMPAANLLPGLGLAGLPVGLPSLVPGVAVAQQTAPPPPPPYVPNPEDTKLSCVLVSNIAEHVSLQEIQEIFAAFGSIVQSKEVPATTTNTSTSSSSGRGAAGNRKVIVEYADPSAAKATADSMNAFDLAGKQLRVDVVSRLRMQQEVSPSTMAHTFTTVLLERMVTLEDTKDPGLKDEIAEEARNYGNLKDVELVIDEVQGEVEVRLLYADAASAAKAHKAMNGRAFAGNKISAVLAP